MIVGGAVPSGAPLTLDVPTGSATLTVRDAEGTQVYSGQLATSGEPQSDPAGVAGAWTITIVYTDYSNSQVNFAVLKQ